MQSEKQLARFNHSLIAHLYQRYTPTLLMFLRRQVQNREDAEDVLLEVFQAAIESETLNNLDESKQRAWLWRVAHHKVADYYRRARQNPPSPTELEKVQDLLFANDASTPEDVTLRHEAYGELRTYISSLPELQQEILRLRFAHGLKCSEIAQKLNKSNGAIRMMLSRSLNLLRDIYKHSKGDSSDG